MRWSRFLSWAVLGALALGVVAMLGLVMYRQGVSAHEREMQHQEILALQAGMEEANARLEQLGQPPVPVPEATSDTTVVPIGPTDEQVMEVLADYCAERSDCQGKDGVDAEPPEPMTDAQAQSAVAGCFASGLCVMPAPRDGLDGKDGTNGANGDDGHTPTAEELAAIIAPLVAPQVAAYCEANNGCRGADGKNGTSYCEGGVLKEVEVLAREEGGVPDWIPDTVCIMPTEGG
jgi:hypothetical protein